MKTTSTIIVLFIVVLVAAGIAIGLGGAGALNLAENNASSTSSTSSALAFTDMSSTTMASSTALASSTRQVAVLTPKKNNQKPKTNNQTTNKVPGAPNTGGPVNNNQSPITNNQGNTTNNQSPNTNNQGGDQSATSTVQRGFIYIYSNQNRPSVVSSGAKNVNLINFTVNAPADSSATLNELVLGSDQNNTIFNYFENFRLYSNTGYPVSVLQYNYRLRDWRPIFVLSNPLNLGAMTYGQYMIVADLKPGVNNVSIQPMHIYGGSGNMLVSSDAEGSVINVQ